MFCEKKCHALPTRQHTNPSVNNPGKKALETSVGKGAPLILFCCLQMLSVWLGPKFCCLLKSKILVAVKGLAGVLSHI